MRGKDLGEGGGTSRSEEGGWRILFCTLTRLFSILPPPSSLLGTPSSPCGTIVRNRWNISRICRRADKIYRVFFFICLNNMYLCSNNLANLKQIKNQSAAY